MEILLYNPNDNYILDNLPDEIWKPIVANRYEVSNLGRVKSLIGSAKILKQYSVDGGYRQVKLQDKSNKPLLNIRRDSVKNR